jgi:protein ImuB
VLWISLYLPHLAIELRQPPEPGLVAITAGTGPRRHLIACNPVVRDLGIQSGTDIPSALMREPNLRLIERSKADERHAMQGIACWAHQFTSDVCMDLARWTVWLEVGSSLRYFNGLSTAYEKVRDGIGRLGYTASFGIAPTLEAAALLARQSDALPAINRSELRRTLSPLPLGCLDIGAKVIEQLHVTGLRTVEDLLNVPSASLARRFGEDLPDYLQRLVGDRPDVRRRHRNPPVYRRRFDFPEPVESLEGLLFPLRRVLQEFEGYLRGRDTAIQQLTVTLRHRGTAETVLQLVTSAPQRDAVRLFALLREKLERTELPGAVTDIVLGAEEFVEPQITQGDFFDDHQRRNDNWSALLDKLRARLGADAVRRLGLRDDHRPENAWCIASDSKASTVSELFADRPLWLLEPTPVTSLPQLLGTPERIEAGWWAGEDSSRDYYLARTDEGARWWLFRDAGTNRWYLQGLWA